MTNQHFLTCERLSHFLR